MIQNLFAITDLDFIVYVENTGCEIQNTEFEQQVMVKLLITDDFE